MNNAAFRARRPILRTRAAAWPAARRSVAPARPPRRRRCPIEAGRRCHQGLAEVAERRGDLEGAREHLDVAGELFAKHGTKLYVDQVLAKKEILRA